MTDFKKWFVMFLILLGCFQNAAANQTAKLDKPPLSERWFGIFVDTDRVGFYRQIISEAPDGYRLEGFGSVRMKVMGFAKDASIRETYLVSKSLGIRSFEVEQTINGVSSRVSGKAADGILRLKSESGGKAIDKQLRFKGDIFPGPALNIYPLMRDAAAGKVYKIHYLDPEELKLKEVKISVLGEEKTPDGIPAIKLRNNLYPFVNNDIWVDSQGNTLLESVRDGLVMTRVEDPKLLGSFIGDLALAKKDLIYDFSLVRVHTPIRDLKKLTGLSVEITGWNDSLPLLQEGGQIVEKSNPEVITIKTGTLVQSVTAVRPLDAYLKPADKIESDAPEIVEQAKALAVGTNGQEQLAGKLSAWTSDWIRDTLEDGGGALASIKSRNGNCQAHARLYTALARSAGIPTRFVSGLVYMEGKGFLYHSWAESYIGGKWIPVDPTFNQFPADPTHLKLLEGQLKEDMAPLVSIIGKIKLNVLETRY